MRLTKAQEKSKQHITDSMEQYKTALAELDTEYAIRKELLKDPVREAVNEGVDAGLPQRQLHVAAGYAHPSGLTNFLEAGRNRIAGFKSEKFAGGWATSIQAATVAPKEIRPKVGPVRVTIPDDIFEDYIAIDEYGDEWAFDHMNGGGTPDYPRQIFQKYLDELPEDQQEPVKKAFADAIGTVEWV